MSEHCGCKHTGRAWLCDPLDEELGKICEKDGHIIGYEQSQSDIKKESIVSSKLISTVGDIRKAIEGCQDNDLVIAQIIPKDGKVFVFPITIGTALMNDSVLVVTVKHERLESLILED